MAGADQGWAAQPPGPALASALAPSRIPHSARRSAAQLVHEPSTPASRESLTGPARLAEFFAPRSIAVVGASAGSGWARFVYAAAAATGFAGDLIPVHHTKPTVFGRPAARSLRELDVNADLAFLLVPTGAVESVLDDAAAAGMRSAVVLASDYGETGPEGKAREERLAERAASRGITLLGPNCLGFINAHARVAPFALTVPTPLAAGPVGIALQSGALASVILNFARSRAIGVSTLVTLGNEAMISASDVIGYLADDERTRVICLFLEQIGDPAEFAAAARKAAAAGKPIVALKAGSSPAGMRAALAHTGAIAGDDAVVDAAFRQLNVIRVTSIEELLSTAALLGYGRPLTGRRMGVLTASGGACGIIADRAAAQGIVIPSFAPSTAAAIAPHVPPFAQVRNPLDVTGYFLANRRTSALTAIDHALDAAVDDKGLDFVFFSGPTLPDTKPADEKLAGLLEERVAWVGRRMASAPIPVVAVGYTCVDVTEYGRDLLGRHGIHMLGGIELGLTAIGNALRWAEGRERSWPGPVPLSHANPAPLSHANPAPLSRANPALPAPHGAWRESDARALLTSCGIPVVPGVLADSPRTAAEAARRLGYPVALRISSARITHKSDAGGVALGLRTTAHVQAGYRRVRAAAAGLPAADVDGVMVSPMRAGGVELLAGVSVDPVFGPVLAVGLGGIWVEVFGDVSLRVLPVGLDEVLRMLSELRGEPLLRGERGGRPADLRSLATTILRIADAALSLGNSLRSLEVNPLWVDGDRIEALDFLVITAAPTDDAPNGIEQAPTERISDHEARLQH
jgi:acetate---CoA ligase (ADP-forming)